MKENALTSPTLGILSFPIIYLLFKIGCSPLAMSWTLFVVYVLLGLVQKPYLLIKIVGYSIKDIASVFIPCFKVLFLGSIIPFMIYLSKDRLFQESYVYFIIIVIVIVSVLSVILSAYFWGLNKEMRTYVISLLNRTTKK